MDKIWEKILHYFRETEKLLCGILKQLRNRKKYAIMNIKNKEGKILFEEDRIMEKIERILSGADKGWLR